MPFISRLLDPNTPVDNWISKNFPIFQTILIILITLAAIVILVAVLMSPSNAESGNNAITGKNESYYGANKGDTKENRLKKLIIICAVLVLVFTIAYFIMYGIYKG